MNKKKIEPFPVKIPFDNVDFLHKWDEWIMYRKQRHLANYVPIGIQKTFDRLFLDSGGNMQIAIKIIDQSIEKNWQGLFPLKTQYNGSTSATISDDKLKTALAGRY